MNPSIYRVQYKPSVAISLNNVALVGQTAMQFVDYNDNRHYVRLENAGTSNIYIGLSSNITWGATGVNLGILGANSAVTFEAFAGALYGIGAGASTAVTHPVKVFEY